MIRIINKIPYRVTVACSGGVDSMAIIHFLMQGRRKINLAFFNHDTIHSKDAEKFVRTFAASHDFGLTIGRVRGTKGSRSLEEFWRDERYEFFNGFKSRFLITCHHLDDVVETWLMSSICGNPKLIPYQRGENIFRPFLMTEKSKFIKYAEDRKLDWVEDPSNDNTTYIRNYVRHILMPNVLKINPGIRKTIRKKLIEIYSR